MHTVLIVLQWIASLARGPGGASARKTVRRVDTRTGYLCASGMYGSVRRLAGNAVRAPPRRVDVD